LAIDHPAQAAGSARSPRERSPNAAESWRSHRSDGCTASTREGEM